MNKPWTEGRIKSFIVSVLRTGARRWPPRYEALADACIGQKINIKSGRLAKHYICNSCKEEFTSKDVEVNHIETVVPLDGFTSWDNFISRLFCSKDKLEVLCKPCHKILTKQENIIRKELTTKQEQATYQCWLDMKSRCYNPNSVRFYTHGGRGITVCKQWIDSFDAFKLDMGLKPDKYSIDRIDNNLGYYKENCRWATPLEQAQNRRTNVYITWDEQTLTLKEWSDILGLSFSALAKRLAHWPLEKAMSSERFDNQVIPLEVKQEIMMRYHNGSITQKELGALYGIAQGTISDWIVQEKQQ